MGQIIGYVIVIIVALEILEGWRWLHRQKERSKAFRRELIQLYGERCMICMGSPVEAHHIVSLSKGGNDDVPNGILLCHKHHMAAHKNEITASELFDYKKRF